MEGVWQDGTESRSFMMCSLLLLCRQGTFKRPVLMEHLVYGMEFSRQLSNLPAPWFLENMLLPLARKISPSLRVGTLEDPFFFSPIITASQVRTGGAWPCGGVFVQAGSMSGVRARVAGVPGG